ncbi:hypothetical protein ER308_13970 [Egibacter rhizosphaerae]|uniref:Uncharacterized protein n=1 Tax=Egibacter rhizosphaerae TaxID=1670831 RepID=A0A411YH23_9ACTN|nr:hypothetical protein [Egibacter rhizosphaerae]QBI20558.1 hypothetical protein ER308_13970 [Egibacter rhizosphaerae]
MSDNGRFTCALTPEEVASRRETDREAREQFRQLQEHQPRRAVLEFTREAEPAVRTFVRDESQCCSFFGFDVGLNDESTVLEISVPEGGEHMLQGLVEEFTH